MLRWTHVGIALAITIINYPNLWDNSEMRAVLLGIDFNQHTLVLAKYLLGMLAEMLQIKETQPQPVALSRSLNALFYRNKIEPGLPPDNVTNNIVRERVTEARL